VLLGLLVVVLTAPVVWLSIDETAVPPASDAPELRDEVTATSLGVSCGSGGCWRAWALTASPSQSGRDLADSIDVPEESCAARSVLDRRKVCTWVEVVRGEARLFLGFERSPD
jgi:hypothetical protein